MNKTNMLIVILLMLSASAGNVLAAEPGGNISANETIAPAVADTITVNESVNVINITKNSNETTIDETATQKMSSPGFSLIDMVISLIIAMVLIMYMRGGI